MGINLMKGSGSPNNGVLIGLRGVTFIACLIVAPATDTIFTDVFADVPILVMRSDVTRVQLMAIIISFAVKEFSNSLIILGV